jgi:hypothetical protein
MKTHCSVVTVHLLIGALLTSCISTKNIPISSGDRAAMRGKTVIPTKRDMPAFGVLKPEAMAAAALGGAIGGAIAGGMAESQGKAQVAKHHLPIPEETISTQVMKNLVAKTGASPLSAPSSKVADDKPAAIAAQYQPADYVLDIRTTGWMGTYYPFTFSKYFIVYGAQMRLIETKSGRIVAQGFGSYQGKDKANAPDFTGIYANNAAFLRAETRKGTDAAIQTFTAQF